MENIKQSAHYKSIIDDRKNILRLVFAQIITPRKPFVLEIGCGHGHFLTAFAQAHPDRLCVGVDMESKRIQRAVRKRERAELGNLHFVHSEAHLFLDTLPPDAVFSDVFVLFPDPWPKLRHHKNRILQADFLTKLAPRAGENTRLYFRTDFFQYFEDASTAISDHADWQVLNETWPFEHETVFQSRANNYHSLVAKRRALKP